MQRTLKYLFGFLIVAVASVCFCFTVVRARRAAVDPTEVTDHYAEEISKTYDFKFGSNPFAPSNATTTTGTFIPGEMFVLSKRCGTCHTDAHAQWRQSAH